MPLEISDLSLQLYSLRHEFSVAPEATLRSIPKLGFKGIELAGDYGWSVDEWRWLLDDTHLQVVGSHQGLEILETRLAERLAFHQAIGANHLIVPGLSPGERQSVAGFRDAARRLNAVGRTLRDEGFALSYHNHDFEFAVLAGAGTTAAVAQGIDILLAETDPALVRFEVDIFWVEYVGFSALEFLRNNAARVSLLHAKDLRRRDRKNVPVGQGDVDFDALLAMCSANEWPIVVEFEGRDALEAVRQGAAYLRTILR